MISYFNRNNRHGYDRSTCLSISSRNISVSPKKEITCPSKSSSKRSFNHGNTRFNINLLRRCISPSITLTNNSRSFSMIPYPNRKKRFLNISSRNSRITIGDSLFFNCNRCNYFYFNGRVIFKPLLLMEVNMSSK